MDGAEPSDGSYYVPAHLERAGPFNPNGNNGFNIEHLRNFNNAAPTVAFGMETQPGHGASDARGEYTVRRNNFGGASATSTASAAPPTAAPASTARRSAACGTRCSAKAATSGSSRAPTGTTAACFGPDDRRSTQDFYPGEYQRDFVMVRDDDGKPQSQRRTC